MREKVSVIIPSYNRLELLLGAIQSCVNQTVLPDEIIVVDDGSDDGTGRAVKSLSGPIRYLRQNKQGPGAARNLGIKAARHSLIALLDSDDRWTPEKLALQVAAMKNHPHYLVSHTNEIWLRNSELLAQKHKHLKYGGFIFSRCLPLCAVSPSTVIMRKRLFEKIGSFDERMPVCEDYDLWLRISLRHPFLLLNKSLTIKRGGRDDQVSRIYARGIDRYRIWALAKILTGNETLTPDERDQAMAEIKRKCLVFGKGCLKHGREELGLYFSRLPDLIRRRHAREITEDILRDLFTVIAKSDNFFPQIPMAREEFIFPA